MSGRAHGRLLTWVLWTFRLRGRMRRALYFGDPTRVCVGDRLTVFDEVGHPVQAEVVQIDQWGRARLIRDDDVVVERQLA